MWPSACAGRQPIFRGRLNYSVPRWQVGPPLVPATSIPHACCWNRQQTGCPPSGHGIGWGYRYQVPRVDRARHAWFN